MKSIFVHFCIKLNEFSTNFFIFKWILFKFFHFSIKLNEFMIHSKMIEFEKKKTLNNSKNEKNIWVLVWVSYPNILGVGYGFWTWNPNPNFLDVNVCWRLADFPKNCIKVVFFTSEMNIYRELTSKAIGLLNDNITILNKSNIHLYIFIWLIRLILKPD